ncbi:CoA ester lyase [Nocardia sp. CDC159]|uniref:CoA ester lyase n=1 Tax=Nocardia pulmonis TaxID=2951408 RepID=A0A9X2J075_9NOCA|nr:MULTISPECIES: CoA ester lyase [Nocardia]MCM6778223.1 CoA ester lyase [Nocardia pulmonis]MCM6791112.1 CoA ester lyase [Nocardia sp. CDC159]
MSATARAIPRSIFYTPALSLDRVVKAWSYDADVHLIDLEDSVPPEQKSAARTICREALDKAPNPANIAVRINELGTVEAVRDLLLLTEGSTLPGFIVMTMVRSPAEITVVRDVFASADRHPEIYVTVETVEAVGDMAAIAAVADGLIFGSADFAATLGIEVSWAGMLGARHAMAMACARYGIGCIDTSNFHLDQPASLQEEIDGTRALGFHGKVAIHPDQLDAINRCYRPDPDALRFARRVTAAVPVGGVAVLDGNMVGPPFARKARADVALADAWAARFGASSGTGKEAGHDQP